jgi:hypothetical protein
MKSKRAGVMPERPGVEASEERGVSATQNSGNEQECNLKITENHV